MKNKSGEKIVWKGDQRVVSRYGYMIRMDENQTTKVWKAEGSGARVTGRPRNGWMERVERVLGMSFVHTTAKIKCKSQA